MRARELKAIRLAESEFERIQRAAKSACLKFQVPESDVDDVAHHGFIEAVRAAQLYLDGRQNSATYWTYASRRVRFAMSVFIRTRHFEFSKRLMQSRQAIGQWIICGPLEGEPVSESVAVVDESETIIDQICRDMPRRTREIMRARFIDGLENWEIARRFRTKRNSIAVTLYKTLVRLRKQVNGKPQPAPHPLSAA